MKKVLKLKDSNLSWFSYHPSVWYLDLWDADPAVGVLIQHLQDQLLQLFTDFGPEEKTKWRFGKSFLTHMFPSCLPEEEIEWLYLTWDTLNKNSMKLWLFCCLLYQAVFVNMQKIIYSFLGLAVGKKTSPKTNQNFYSPLEDLVTWSLNSGSALNCQQVVTCWTKWSQQKHFGPFV